MSPIEKVEKNKKKIFSFLVIICMIAGVFGSVNLLDDRHVASAFTNWANNDFTYRALCSVSNAYVDTDLTNFPVYFNFTDNSDIYEQVTATGYDIVFYDWYDNSTLLNFEMISYSYGGGVVNGEWYVNLTTVYADHLTYFWVYWGDADGGNLENPTDVWDSDYLAVWHLENLTDSTSNGYDLTNSGATDSVTGYTGLCYDLEASDPDKLYHGTLLDTPVYSSLTLECFIKREATGVEHTIWSKFNSGTEWIFLRVLTNDSLIFSEECSGESPSVKTTATIDTGWHYVGFTATDESPITAFVDETFQTQGSFEDMGEGTTKEFDIGNYGWNDGSPFDGYIDEFRLSKTQRTEAWLKASYRSSRGDIIYNVGTAEQDVEPASSCDFILHNDLFTWQGFAGRTVWCNDTGTYNEWGEFNFSYNGTQDFDYLLINISDLDDPNVTASNINMYLSVDNSTWRDFGAFEDGSLNTITVDADTWTDEDDPFPVNSNSSIWMILSLDIPPGIGNETYSVSTSTWTWSTGYYT